MIKLFALVIVFGFLNPALSAKKVTTEIATEVVKKIEKKAEEKIVEKSKKITARPDEWMGPTEVYFAGFILDIDGINDTEQNFDGNLFLQLSWLDRRLAHSESNDRQLPLTEIWNPRIIITNQQGRTFRALPEVVNVDPDGRVTYRQRYTGKLSQPLNLGNFPMDKHMFKVQFAAAGYEEKHLTFIPKLIRDLNGGGIADKLSLPDWKISSFEAKSSPYRPVKEISTAGFVFQFEAERFFTYYIWQIILPFSVVIIMSWSAFLVRREHVGIRIGVATSSVLTLIANRFMISSLLPKLPYMTRLDYFSVGATFLVLFALIGVVLSSIFTGEEEYISKRIDLTSKILLPLSYIVIVWAFFFL